jgi:hypothetical protein
VPSGDIEDDQLYSNQFYFMEFSYVPTEHMVTLICLMLGVFYTGLKRLKSRDAVLNTK